MTSKALIPGQWIGSFLLLSPLGTGGSGLVWAAARVGPLGFTKRIAIKLLRQDKAGSERARERFDREARLAAHLQHPNLRAVHDVGSHEGRPYMAMRWAETSLAEVLAHAPNRRIPAEVACWIAIQLCDALAAAHGFVNRAGRAVPIVHRDVSPDNVLLTARGHVLLSDPATATDPDGFEPSGEPESETRFFGNLGYSSPEALTGESVDPRSDLFSLGCVLYEALGGAPPFDAKSEHSVVFQVIRRGARDLAERAPDVPQCVAAVVARAMSREPSRRFASALEMGSALGRCVAGSSSFELEERTAATVRLSVGDLVRAREEVMRQTFRRFGPPATDRTASLPLSGKRAKKEEEKKTLGSGLSPAPVSDEVPSRPIATARARSAWVVAALLTTAIALTVTVVRRPEAPPPVGSASTGASGRGQGEAASTAEPGRAARSTILALKPAPDAGVAARGTDRKPAHGLASRSGSPAPTRGKREQVARSPAKPPQAGRGRAPRALAAEIQAGAPGAQPSPERGAPKPAKRLQINRLSPYSALLFDVDPSVQPAEAPESEATSPRNESSQGARERSPSAPDSDADRANARAPADPH